MSVCRTCLYMNENLTSFKSMENVKDILVLCVPEIKPNISTNTIICTQCYYFLKNIENFRLKCIENQKRLINYNVFAHSTSQEYQLFPNTSITIIPAGETPSSYTEMQKSETVDETIVIPKNFTVIENQNDTIQEPAPKIKPKTNYKKSKIYKPKPDFKDIIEISDSEVELNDKTQLSYGESSHDDDDVFEETPFSLSVVKNEPDEEVNPSFFNKKSEEGFYHCKLCTKKYKQSVGLYNHTLAEHKELKFYHCDSCNFFTLWKSALTRHESLFHTDGNSSGSSVIEELFLFCYHCQYKTKSKPALESHIRIHFNPKKTRYTCSKCNKSFLKENRYHFHMQLHEKDQITICEYCAKSYSKKHLRRHQIEVHGVYETFYFCDN